MGFIRVFCGFIELSRILELFSRVFLGFYRAF